MTLVVGNLFLMERTEKIGSGAGIPFTTNFKFQSKLLAKIYFTTTLCLSFKQFLSLNKCTVLKKS